MSLQKYIIHNYTLTIEYKETGLDQRQDMGNIIEGKVEIYDQDSALELYISDQEYLAKKIYDIDIKYGDKVNYVSGVQGDTSTWKFLGIEDGHILLLTDTNIAQLTLEGREGYNTGLSKLQAASSPYGNGLNALKARSITAEDVNKVTGYNPAKELTGRPYEYGNQPEYGSTGTWWIESTETGGKKIMYKSDKGIEGEYTSDQLSVSSPDLQFQFLKSDGTLLEEGIHSEKSNFYWYIAEARDNAYHMSLNVDVMALSQQELDLFKEKNLKPAGQDGAIERANRYWLATESILGKPATLSHGIMHLGSSETQIRVYRERLINSWDQSGSYTYGVRPVVYLDKNIKLVYDNANDVWNISKNS